MELESRRFAQNYLFAYTILWKAMLILPSLSLLMFKTSMSLPPQQSWRLLPVAHLPPYLAEYL